MSNLFKKILNVQADIRVPKGKFNAFGKYKYRNCEDILRAVKPLLKRENLILTISDEVLPLQDRYYVKSTATIIDAESGDSVSASGWAREEETKKGMDASQVTGSTSSYARKIALSGCLLLNDILDSDTTNDGTTPPDPEKKQEEDALAKMHSDIIDLCVKLGGTKNEQLMTTIKKYSKNGNPKAIKNLAKAEELFAEIKKLK